MGSRADMTQSTLVFLSDDTPDSSHPLWGLVDIRDVLLYEFDTEMANTRMTLKRVPESKLSYNSHEEAGGMGWLANHLGNIAGLACMVIHQNSVDIEPNGVPIQPPSPPTSVQELIERFDKNARDARVVIAGMTDADLVQPWSLVKNGRTLTTIPRVSYLQGFVINHTIYHRAQLDVYLRHGIP